MMARNTKIMYTNFCAAQIRSEKGRKTLSAVKSPENHDNNNHKLGQCR